MSAPETEKVTISDHLFRGVPLEGCYGVEVEVEGENLPTSINGQWNVTRDGSLRGEAYEYVFKMPLDRDTSRKAIHSLYKKLAKSTVHDTGRAGVHVHMNVRDLTLQETLSFILLYLVFEEVLLDFCGEDRKGNLFCLRSDDAEYFLISLKDFIENLTFNSISSDRIRYSSINLTALKKYGSLEFRSLPSPVSEEKLNVWIDLLTRIRNKAVGFNDPRLIVAGVSEYGGEDFAKSILEDDIQHLDCNDWNKAVFRGMRKIQPLVESVNHDLIATAEKRVLLRKKEMAEQGAYDIDFGAALMGVRPPVVNEEFVRRVDFAPPRGAVAQNVPRPPRPRTRQIHFVEGTGWNNTDLLAGHRFNFPVFQGWVLGGQWNEE